MVMRPYQITATERILNRIEIANNYKKYGSVEGGGYIWHTQGSGKTGLAAFSNRVIRDYYAKKNNFFLRILIFFIFFLSFSLFYI